MRFSRCSASKPGPCRAPARHPIAATSGAPASGALSMIDIVMLVIGIGFFAAAGLYSLACDRL
jgi:hypothetical protein